MILSSRPAGVMNPLLAHNILLSMDQNPTTVMVPSRCCKHSDGIYAAGERAMLKVKRPVPAAGNVATRPQSRPTFSNEAGEVNRM
jgi:hypothetical protein